MRLLLDTQALLWWMADSPRLGPKARELIADAASDVWVSVASAWEIAIKVGLGRLDLSEPAHECFPRELERGGFEILPIGLEHALSVDSLPYHHRDPFDRMLIAQARMEGLRIVTADRLFAAYSVDLIDALN